MTTDGAMTLLTRFVETAVFVAAPILAVAALVGIMVGIVQTATQINEPAIPYAAKVVAVVLLTVLAGPAIADKILTYTRDTFQAVSRVVD